VTFLDGAEERREPVTTALVESAWGLSTYDGTLAVRAARQVPEHLDVDLDLHVQLPPDFDLHTLSEQEEETLQGFVESLQSQLLGSLEEPVRGEVARQAPIVDYSASISGLKWTQRQPAAAEPPAEEDQAETGGRAAKG